MIRLAVKGEGQLVHDRLEAEIAREGFAFPVPPAPAIEISIGQRDRLWYIDDDDPTVIAHAYLEDDGIVYVPHVWNVSARDEEILRFLANDLLARFGNRTVVYMAGNTRGAKADQLVRATKQGSVSRTTLKAAADALNKAAAK